MKKFLILITVCCLLTLTLTSCQLIDYIGGLLTPEPDHAECVDENHDHKCDVCGEVLSECIDVNGDFVCDVCGAELERPEPDHTECVDENHDHKCDVCGEVLSECIDVNGDFICDICGADFEHEVPPELDHTECIDDDHDHKCDVCEKVLSECADGDKDHKCDICGEVLSECTDGDKDHKCDVCGEVLSECADGDKDHKCDVCGADMIPEGYEVVKYYLNISDFTAEKLASDKVSGPFTIVSGTEIRNRTRTFTDSETGESTTFTVSAKLGGSSNAIKIKVNGTGTLSFIIQNGSSGANTQKVKITAPDGTTQEIEFDGANKSSPLVVISVDVTEGEWKINRVSGTIDIYELSLECLVEKSEESGFELVSTGKVEYLLGGTLDLSELTLNKKFENGKTEALDLELVTVDQSGVDFTKSGKYPVVVSYKDYDPITYYVSVYAPESVTLGVDAIEKLDKNTSAGNGVYFNHSFREVYGVGDTLDTKGLTVVVGAKCGDDEKEFIVKNYEISGFDSTSAGKKTLTVKYLGSVSGETALTASFDVYVVDTEPSVVNGVYQVRVDKTYEGTVGAVVDGYNTFTTIQQALDFLEDAPAESNKLIRISNHTYYEKIEITIPNLGILGEGGNSAIIWNSLYGQNDESGFSHVTDSTATVAIRESAYNCKINNLIIANYWNSKDVFDSAFGEGKHDEHRALALLVQADRFTMENGALLGYQDTVEFFTGRQFLYGVFISGTTDFIFGTNNTTVFLGCQIHSISSGKTDGGYITAFKGCNKGDDDYVQYGAVFLKCSFTADEDVVANGNTAIGRCWGKYASVALIACDIDGHVSTKGFSGSSKNERYVSMNAKPTESTVNFVEYNNAGAGAITEAVAGMRFLTDEEYEAYSNIANVFGKTNGKVSYAFDWDPNSSEVQVDTNVYYFFNGQSSPTGTSYTYDQKLEGKTGTVGDIAIDATTGKVSARGSDTQINATSTLTFTVKAGSKVTIATYPGYHDYSINGTAASEDTQEWTFDADTTVVFTANAQVYLYSIIISK